MAMMRANTMIAGRFARGVLALLVATLLWAGEFTMDAQAQSATANFVRVAPRVSGVLYQPAKLAKSDLAIVVMHDNNDFLDHPAAVQLSKRGYLVLAVNPRYAPSLEDHDTDWNVALADLGAAVNYVRALPGVKRVVLVGHSSGAPLMASYQNIAENGLKAACQGPEKIVKCPDSLGVLAPADGLVLLDPIFGVGVNVLASVDPAVIDENAPRKRDAAVDMYDPANGFDPKGATYSSDFRARFLKQQAARNDRLIEKALARLARIQAGQGDFTDDEPFLVPGATRVPSLWRPDVHLLSHTKGEYLLLRPDGAVKQVIHSVRVPQGLSPTTPLLAGGALNTTVKRFLSTFASRSTPDYDVTEDSIVGVDWNSSYTSTPGNMEAVATPILILGMTGHYWIVSAETAFTHAASKDKSIAFVEGATHGFTPCAACEKTPGQFGDTMKTTFDYVASWLDRKY